MAALSVIPGAAHELDKRDKLTLEELIDGAKKEGKLTFYSAFTTFTNKLLVAKFMEAYPFVKVEFVRAGGLVLAQRFYAEKARKIEVMDIIESGAAEVYPDWRKKGYVSRVDNLPEYASVIDIAKDPNGYYVAFSFVDHVLAWNRKLHKDQDIPDDLWEFTKPQWKGKTASGDPAGGGFALNWFSFASDVRPKDARSKAGPTGLGFQWMKAMAKNDHLLSGQIGNLTDTLVSGRRGIAVQHWYAEIAEAKANGADIGWKYPRQGAIAQHLPGAINANAPHPYSARLFLNWLLSKEGQALMMKAVFVNTVRKDMKTADFLPGRRPIEDCWVLDIERIRPDETKVFLQQASDALRTSAQ